MNNLNKLSTADYVLMGLVNTIALVATYVLRDGLTVSAIGAEMGSVSYLVVFAIDWLMALFLTGSAYLGARALWRATRSARF
ncbi:MAG: hypothetical protein HOI95_15865 [Chromatiales bacterium]|jgi:hypothetical protein|nr:hypothetical protein [Chromatiales bacterium]